MPNENFIAGSGGYNPYAGSQYPTPNRPRQMECPKCGCTYLEEKKIARFSDEQNNVLGTPVLSVSESYYYIYVCIQCNMPVEQPLHFMGVDPGRKEHSEIVGILKKKAQPEE